MYKEESSKNCVLHPKSIKEFYCEMCQTAFCETCFNIDKNHKKNIFPLKTYGF